MSRMHPDAVAGIAEHAARLGAVVQTPCIDDHGIVFAMLWTDTEPGALSLGFVAATPHGAVTFGQDVFQVRDEALALARSEETRQGL